MFYSNGFKAFARLAPAATLLPAIVATNAAFAEPNQGAGSGLSYNYAEVRFIDRELDAGPDGDGFLVGGSFEVAPQILVTASFEDLDFGRSGDHSILRVGGGYVHPLQEKIDVVGYASLIHVDGDFDDDTGIGLAGGVRALVAPRFEVRATGNYVDVDDSDTFFDIGADYWISEQFSAGLSATIGGDADTITFGGRWFFDN